MTTTTPEIQPDPAAGTDGGPTAAVAALAVFEQTLTDALAAFTDALISAAISVDLPPGGPWPDQLTTYLHDTNRAAIADLVTDRELQRRQLELSMPHGLRAVDALTGYCICGATFPGPPSVTVDAVLAHLTERAEAAAQAAKNG